MSSLSKGESTTSSQRSPTRSPPPPSPSSKSTPAARHEIPHPQSDRPAPSCRVCRGTDFQVPCLGENPADGLEQLGLFRHHRHRGADQGADRLTWPRTSSRTAGNTSWWTSSGMSPTPKVTTTSEAQARDGRVRSAHARANRFPPPRGGKASRRSPTTSTRKGLKFGIHLMRGIPASGGAQNTPIKGTTARAADIANTNSICPWNPDMYGVDMSQARRAGILRFGVRLSSPRGASTT